MKKKILRILKLVLLIPLSILFYVLIAFVCSYIPYNRAFKESSSDSVKIFLHSNGVHTDILVPVKNEQKDWSALLPNLPASTSYVAMGWGDKGFYLNTPTWADLKFSTAFKAAFWMSTTAMHITPYEQAPELSENTVGVNISKEQYQILCIYIENSFQYNEEKQLTLLRHDPRYYRGNFYDAVGTYSILTSCNSWVNKAMKVSGIRTCLWTPFDWPLLKALK